MFKGLHLFNQVLLSVLLLALSPPLFLNFCQVQLFHFFFSHLVQITVCSGSWLGSPACKAARPVPALGPVMVMATHWLPSSEAMRHDKFSRRVKRVGRKRCSHTKWSKVERLAPVPDPWRRSCEAT